MSTNILEQILQAITAARYGTNGTKRMRLTFKRDALTDVSYLLGMVNGKIIEITSGDQLILTAVLQSRSWDRDQNRTVVVTMTDTFDAEWFTERMRRALEKIEAV